MKVMGVVSGKGGVGKTTTVANIGAALSSEFCGSVAAVDGNFTTPNLGLHLGVHSHLRTITDVINKKASITQATYIHHSGLRLIPTELSSYSMKINPNKLQSILKELKEYEMVLVDSAPGVERENVPVIEASDEVLIITNPDVPSVVDAMKTIELAETVGTPVRGIEVNRVRGERHEISPAEIELICGTRVIAVIPEDRYVRKGIADGNPVVLNSPYSPAAIEFRRLAAHLIGERFAYLLGDRLKWFLGFGMGGRVKVRLRPWKQDWRVPPERSEELKIREKLLTTLNEYRENKSISEDTYKKLKEKLS